MNPLQLIKKAPWRKIALGFSFLFVLLATLVVLVGAWFSYQGRREWAETKAELLSRGEVLSYEGLVPAPVPPEENFFADPIWEPNAEGRIDLFALQINAEEAERFREEFSFASELIKEGKLSDIGHAVNRRASGRDLAPEEAELILAVMERMGGDFETLGRLAARPQARFPIDYEKGAAILMPHITALMKAGQMLAMRAKAQAVLRQGDRGAENVILILRLAKATDGELSLMSFLVKMSLYSMAINTMEAALPYWTAGGVEQVAQAMEDVDILGQTARAFRGERAFVNQVMDQLAQAPLGEVLKTIQSTGEGADVGDRALFGTELIVGAYRLAFFDENRALLNRNFQRWIDFLEGDPGMLRPADFEKLNAEMKASMQGVNQCQHMIVYLAFPVYQATFAKAASIESGIRQARIACAIQKYALSKRGLPSALDQLVPQYLESPTDVINGEPMHYRSNGKEYVLWSVGWNEKDDGGEESPKTIDPVKKLDWVWKGRLPDAVAAP